MKIFEIFLEEENNNVVYLPPTAKSTTKPRQKPGEVISFWSKWETESKELINQYNNLLDYLINDLKFPQKPKQFNSWYNNLELEIKEDLIKYKPNIFDFSKAFSEKIKEYLKRENYLKKLEKDDPELYARLSTELLKYKPLFLKLLEMMKFLYNDLYLKLPNKLI